MSLFGFGKDKKNTPPPLLEDLNVPQPPTLKASTISVKSKSKSHLPKKTETPQHHVQQSTTAAAANKIPTETSSLSTHHFSLPPAQSFPASTAKPVPTKQAPTLTPQTSSGNKTTPSKPPLTLKSFFGNKSTPMRQSSSGNKSTPTTLASILPQSSDANRMRESGSIQSSPLTNKSPGTRPPSIHHQPPVGIKLATPIRLSTPKYYTKETHVTEAHPSRFKSRHSEKKSLTKKASNPTPAITTVVGGENENRMSQKKVSEEYISRFVRSRPQHFNKREREEMRETLMEAKKKQAHIHHGVWGFSIPESAAQMHMQTRKLKTLPTGTSFIKPFDSDDTRESLKYYNQHAHHDFEIHHDDYGLKRKTMMFGRARASSVSFEGNKARKSRPSTTSSVLAGAKGASSWEYWWIKSPVWKRRNVFLILILFVVSLLNLAAGLFFLIANSKLINIIDLTECRTPKCQHLADRMLQSMNGDLNPCESFYKFICDNHTTTDTGNLFDYWHQNFARLESGGATILPNLLMKGKDELARKVIKYYQVCLNTHQRRNMPIEKSLTYFIRNVMGDFDLWETDFDKEPTLEIIASRMVGFVGDYGLMKVLEPIEPGYVTIDTFNFIGAISNETIGKFLPTIYNALNITDLRDQSEILRWLVYFADKAYVLEKFGYPKISLFECNTASSTEATATYFNLFLPYGLVQHGRDDYPHPLPRTILLYKHKGTFFQVGVNAELDYRLAALTQFYICWNQHTKKIPDIYVRAVYATFWSLRLLDELVLDVDEVTLEEFKDNPFFAEFNKQQRGLRLEARCFQSLHNSMGHYPIFRYFQTIPDGPAFLNKVGEYIVDSAFALEKQFRPAEEGGLSFISTYYRERAYRILKGYLDVNILIGVREDDPTFNVPFPDVTDKHEENIYNWRRFTENRTWNFRRHGYPKRKLVWYRNFYYLDVVTALENPGASKKFSYLAFPWSLFNDPYFNQDMLVADYAGSRNLVQKSWMKLLFFDYRKSNIEAEINDKINNNNEENYHEGIVSDGGFEKCQAIAFGWEVNRGPKTRDEHKLAVIDAHFFAFRFVDLNPKSVAVVQKIFNYNAFFPHYISLRLAFLEYKAKYQELTNKPFWSLKKRDQDLLIHRKLVHFNKYTIDQLFFMLAFRGVCRSRVHDEPKFYNHVTENVDALMQMKEFAETFNCPTMAPMNPPNRCF